MRLARLSNHFLYIAALLALLVMPSSVPAQEQDAALFFRGRFQDNRHGFEELLGLSEEPGGGGGEHRLLDVFLIDWRKPGARPQRGARLVPGS